MGNQTFATYGSNTVYLRGNYLAQGYQVNGSDIYPGLIGANPGETGMDIDLQADTEGHLYRHTIMHMVTSHDITAFAHIEATVGKHTVNVQDQ